MADNSGKITLNLEQNYPHLHQLRQSDQEKFIQLVKGTLSHLDHAVKENYPADSEAVFKKDYADLINTIMSAFMDYKGIADQHPNKAEAAAMKELRHDNNPVSIFTDGSPAYTAAGEKVLPQDWAGMDSFDLKEWLQNLLYGARFVSLGELASYLSLGQYELIDVLKARNLPQLMPIQPALAWQEKNRIPAGKLRRGTGYFDGGTIAPDASTCPACENQLNHQDNCDYCKAGFYRED